MKQGGGGGGSSQPVSIVNVTSAQILALDTTPVTLVPARCG